MYDKFYYTGDVQAAIEHAKQNTRTEFTWVLHKDVDYSNFDLRFLPDRYEQNQAHTWSSHNNADSFTTWLLPANYQDIHFHEEILPFVNNVKTIYWPDFTETVMHGDSWQDSLCNWLLQNEEITDEWTWVIDNRIDYSVFNFDWLPKFYDQEYIHCFTNRDKSQLSYTWLVNRKVLQQRKFKFIEERFEFTSFNKLHADIVVLDLGCHIQYFDFVDKKIKFIGTMEQMLKTAIKKTSSEYLWVLSSCCDYSKFDFTWLPDADKVDYTHCWPSSTQKKGDTFLIHVPTYLRTGEFVYDFDHEPVERRPWPVVIYNEDSLAAALKTNKSSSLYTLYTKNNNLWRYPHPCLWYNRPVVGFNTCNSTSLVPRECVVKEEIYEYPYLEKLGEQKYAEPINLSIMFIENGETCAANNWMILNLNLPKNITYPTRIVGHKTRLGAYKAAAQSSISDWFVAVFAKCEILETFKTLKWRPDYWQKPKHYIFYNHNRDLDLTYGHMAPIAYNKRLMLENTGGLDMTLAQDHAVVPIVISETHLTDPWETWRTAFRETAKLMYYAKNDNSLELQYRLQKWLTGTDKNTWFKKGADDAVDYFESIDGDLGWLMLTNEWDFIRQIYERNHKTVLTV